MKSYFIKYTIIDGGVEYGDQCLYGSEREPDDAKLFDFEFVTTFWEKDDLEWDSENERWELCDGRIFQLESCKEVPEEDLEILRKYI